MWSVYLELLNNAALYVNLVAYFNVVLNWTDDSVGGRLIPVLSCACASRLLSSNAASKTRLLLIRAKYSNGWLDEFDRLLEKFRLLWFRRHKERLFNLDKYFYFKTLIIELKTFTIPMFKPLRLSFSFCIRCLISFPRNK